MPGTGECTEGKVKGEMDIVPTVVKLTVLPEGHVSKHATTTQCGRSCH